MRSPLTICKASCSYCDLRGLERSEWSRSTRAAARDCVEPKGKSAGHIPVAACAKRILLRLMELSFILSSLTVGFCRAHNRGKPLRQFALGGVAVHLVFGHAGEEFVQIN